MSIKIIIADDHPMLVDGILGVIREMEIVELADSASNGRHLIARLRQTHFDIVLLDLNMPQLDGIETLKIIKKEFIKVKVIVFTSYGQPELLREIKKLDAEGYLVKNCSSVELKEAISAVAGGAKWFKGVPSNTVSEVYNRDDFLKKYQITQREVEILRNIAEGYTSKEIGEKLFISEFTINAHRRNICRKLNIYTSVGLLNFVRKNGLI
ncbi:response regulator transcription factor [Dyadobacter frigoris]|uniref:Response regulator transcription factor n=1 Tax=Dyadobacter frigoris TaxID=2576211 RepID=A0A4U6D112_9BACT|nr:response regulator transcription factor [Dyadobacter frigoris]TKT90792.1 response regulator transcription factor [Dyadobacter frigoris]GLU52127.1 DNA-binding response regulator [Dyadobacter frigoris]